MSTRSKVIDTTARTGYKSEIFVINPYEEVRGAIERKAWLPGFGTAVSYFEFFAKRGLEKLFRAQRFGVNKKNGKLLDECRDYIERLSAGRVIDLLYWFGKITDANYTKMCEIVKERNTIMHHAKGAHYQLGRDRQDHFRNLLEQSIELMRPLQLL